MSTRSTISVLQENTSVKSIYCHFDGYLRGVGETLLNYYNTYERANALVALGGLSCVYKNLDPLPAAPERNYNGKDKPDIITTHSYDRPQEDVTVAYHRDRKRKFEQEFHGSLEEFYKNNDFQRYNYLFMEGCWYVMSEFTKRSEWVALTTEMIETEETLMKHTKQESMREIYLNKAGTFFYATGFNWNSFEAILGNKKEITLKYLTLLTNTEDRDTAAVVDRPMKQFDNPFENTYLPTTWTVVNDLINATGYLLYEYAFNLTPDLVLGSAPWSGIIMQTEKGDKKVKDEVYKVFGNDCEFSDLIKIAEAKPERLLTINKENKIVAMTGIIPDLDPYLYSI